MTLLNPISRLLKKKESPVSDEVSQSLVEELNSSYSHPGLEEIYTLESIDPRTIRRISAAPPEESITTPSPLITTHSPLNQLELPLGDEFVSTIESFVLNEPLHVLKLGPTVILRLKEQGITRLRDLVEADWSKLLFVKGLGQGHLDEIQGCLRHYLEGKSLFITQNIDFEAWIRSLLPDNNLKQAVVLFESFDLPPFIAVTPAEQAEIKRLTPERRQQWEEEAIVAFQQNRAQFTDSVQKVLNTFVKPWMRSRQGVAFEYELIDRLHQLAENQQIISSSLDFFRQVFCQGKPLFPQFLVEISPTIYCVDATIANHYKQVKKAAKSYFYKNNINYRLDELAAFIQREWAREWESPDADFIVKVIRSSPTFRVRKAPCGNLMVALAL